MPKEQEQTVAADPVTGVDTPGVAGDEDHRMHDNDNDGYFLNPPSPGIARADQ